jgi:flavin-dependent dehydrogenase
VSVAATLTPAAAAARRWDAVVVGAGPAGATAARELARRGASTLLVDKAAFPRYKVCGCCLNPRSLRLLEAAGLGGLVAKLGGVPLTRVRLAARGAHADVPMPVGAAVSREAFDAALVGAAVAAGAEFLPATSASLRPAVGDGTRVLRLRHERDEFAAVCRVVLAANGLAGRLEEHPADDAGDAFAARAWAPGSRVGAGAVAGAAPGYEPRAIYMACGRDGYVGLVRIEDGRTDVAAALDPLAVKAAGGPGELAAAIIADAGLPAVPGLAALPWKGTPHLTRSAPRRAGERLFVLGDAAGYIEPFTGEGIAWALSSALLVTPLALQGLRSWDPALARRWEAAYRRKVTPRQTVCRITAAMLRRPGLTRVAVGLLSVMPWLARPLFRVMYRD